MYLYDLNMLLENDVYIDDFSKINIPSTVVQRFHSETEPYIKQYGLYEGIKVNDEHYALGTGNGGVVIIDQKGKWIQLLNKRRGLNSNKVYSLFSDRKGNIWVALNDGISLIERSSPITQFDERSGLDARTLCVTRHQGILYLGAYNGIFYLPERNMGIEKDSFGFLNIGNTTSNYWEFKSIGNSLFAGGNSSFGQIIDKTIKINGIEGSIYCFGSSSKFPNHLFLGNRIGLSAIAYTLNSKNPQDFLDVKFINHGNFYDVNNIIRSIVADANGDLWLTTRYNGIIYIRFTGSNISEFETYHYNTSHGLPQDNWNYVYFLDGRLIVATQAGFYEGILPEDFQTNPDSVKFIPENTFGKVFNALSTSASQIVVDKNRNLWVRAGVGPGVLIRQSNGTYTWQRDPYRKITGTNADFYLEPDGIAWFSAQKALYRLDTNQPKDYKSDYYALIRNVTIGKDSVVFHGNYYDPDQKSDPYSRIASLNQPKSLMPKLLYEHNAITFEYSAAFYEHAEANRFKYMLEGYDKDWSSWSAEMKKEYTNLHEGEYRFKVKAKNIFDHESKEALYQFSISPPWYRTVFAYICYGFFFLSFFYVSIKLNSRRLQAAKLRLEKIVKKRTAELNQEIIERKNAENDAKRRASQTALIYNVGQRLSSELELAALLSEIVTAVREAFNYHNVMMLLMDQESNRLTLKSIAGGYSDIISRDHSIAVGEGMIGYAAESGKTQVSGNVSTNPHFLRKLAAQTNSELAVPIKSGDKVVGVLDIQCDKLNIFDDTDIAVVETLSTQIASAIENAQLYAQAQQEIADRKRIERALRESEEKYKYLIENINDVIFSIVENGVVTYISPAIQSILHYDPSEIIGKSLSDFVEEEDLGLVENRFQKVSRGEPVTIECRMKDKSGTVRWMRISEKPTKTNGQYIGSQGVLTDITKQKVLESQLVQAQKLESIGQLAAGIAHEINTPTQYVGDNTRFFKDAFTDISDLLSTYNDLLEAINSGRTFDELLGLVKSKSEEIDLDYLLSEVPGAIQQTLEGIDRVTTIVLAMKDFSHPDKKDKAVIDLNQAIDSTITVSRNEWKFVAEIEVDFDDSLPMVPCFPGELNQVILNIIVNAAHAIEDIVGDGSGEKGLIKIKTRKKGDWVDISIKDTGTGIPENIKTRIFDPFFTTKEVGKGSGQGLSIAHEIIVKKHNGKIDCESEPGKGTTFIISLPVEHSTNHRETAQVRNDNEEKPIAVGEFIE